MLLYLINPGNPLVSLANVEKSRWNRYRVWKPLGLLVLAGLASPEWKIRITNENREVPDFPLFPAPSWWGSPLYLRGSAGLPAGGGIPSPGVPVVMGGVHASMCLEEALKFVDAVVKSGGTE